MSSRKFTRYNLYKIKRELSNAFDKEMELFNKHLHIYSIAFKRYKKMRNKCSHLLKYRSTLYDEYYCELDRDDPKRELIHKKISKISNLLKNAEHDAEVLHFELDILENNYEIHWLGYNKLDKKIESFISINEKNSKIRHVTKKKAKIIEDNGCSICLDNHKITGMVTTSCGHTFGKSCFEKTMKFNYYENNTICCPLCRKNNLEFAIYR
uniref:RING-type domain-containing protein n=1 Tax=viral metagenome TaxID=1070528 RepID=A0A6C0HZ32_9ZZZZ